jgi:hypothetical protein
MFLVWVLTWILQSLNVPDAVTLWHWFGAHELLTILLILFLG